MLVGLNIAAIISEIDNQDILCLINLKAKRSNKKKEKVKRRQ